MGNWIWVLIPLAAIAAGMLRTKYHYEHEAGKRAADAEDGEAARLRREVRDLKERIAVLERIATDRSHTLDQEIERLRDR